MALLPSADLSITENEHGARAKDPRPAVSGAAGRKASVMGFWEKGNRNAEEDSKWRFFVWNALKTIRS